MLATFQLDLLVPGVLYTSSLPVLFIYPCRRSFCTPLVERLFFNIYNSWAWERHEVGITSNIRQQPETRTVDLRFSSSAPAKRVVESIERPPPGGFLGSSFRLERVLTNSPSYLADLTAYKVAIPKGSVVGITVIPHEDAHPSSQRAVALTGALSLSTMTPLATMVPSLGGAQPYTYWTE